MNRTSVRFWCAATSCSETSTAWPRPVRSRSRSAISVPNAACRPPAWYAWYRGGLNGASSGAPSGWISPPAAFMTMSALRKSLYGPVLPNGVIEVITSRGFAAASDS